MFRAPPMRDVGRCGDQRDSGRSRVQHWGKTSAAQSLRPMVKMTARSPGPGPGALDQGLPNAPSMSRAIDVRTLIARSARVRACRQ
jgi:hypothetical protein